MDKKSNLQNQKNKKKPNIKNMGVDIDKNEYYEIVLSNSAHFVSVEHSSSTTCWTGLLLLLGSICGSIGLPPGVCQSNHLHTVPCDPDGV